MSSVEKLTESSDLLVSFAGLKGKTLLLFNGVYWFTKVTFSFFFEVCYKFIFMKQRRYTRIFSLFGKVLKIGQYAFELVAGLATLLDNLE